MRRLIIGLLGALVAANPLTAATNLTLGTTNQPSSPPPRVNEGVEQAYKKLMQDDDAAQAEVDQLIRDNEKAAARGAALPRADLRRRVRERLEPIRSAYEDFIKRHPEHAGARVAYGSFLNDLHEEDGAQEQWERALALNAKDPAVYNNLANLYTHGGPIKKAFEFYAKAIELNPREPLYYHNLGDAVFLFRRESMEFYRLTEQGVYDKALDLYTQALKLDPGNFPLASDLAQTYYGIKPLRAEAALQAWTNALAVAHDEIEREGVYIHLARLKLQAERLGEVRAHLNAVTNDMYTVLKTRLMRNLEEQEAKAKTTNAPPAASGNKQ